MIVGSHYSPARFPDSGPADIAAYFKLAGEMGGPVVLTEQWSEPFDGLFIRQVQNGARLAGLPFHLYLSPLRQDDRTKADYHGLSFADSDCRAAYMSRICELAAIRPDLLGLATEVNLCIDEQELISLLKLLSYACGRIRVGYPGLPLTVSQQYDVYRNGLMRAHGMYALCDVHTFTTYPWALGTAPSRDYYAGLRELVPDGPVGISELGISSTGTCGEWKQLRRYREALVGLQTAGVDFVTLMQMHDLPPMHANLQLTALGVRRADGTAKSAWKAIA